MFFGILARLTTLRKNEYGSLLTVPLSNQVLKLLAVNVMHWATLQWTSISPTGEYKYSELLHAAATGDECVLA